MCAKVVKWAFLDRVWSLQYESKASAFCEPKTSTETTRGQEAHLALDAHHIFCNARIVFRVFLIIKRSLCAAGSGRFLVFIDRHSEQRAFFSLYYPLQRAAGVFQFLSPATASSGCFSVFIARSSCFYFYLRE